MPLSISHQLVSSRGMAAMINHESSKNFSKSPNSSSSSIASTSGNSSRSSSLYENQQQQVANNIFVDVNNFSIGKKQQQRQLLDKFYQSLQAVDENNYKSAKYRLDKQELLRGPKLETDMNSIALFQHQQSQLAANLPPFNNVALFNNPFLHSYYLNLASKNNVGFQCNTHVGQMKLNDTGKSPLLSATSNLNLTRSRTADSKASNETEVGDESESESPSFSKNCSPVRNN